MELEKRVDRLEKECRIYRSIFTGLGLLVLAAVFFGATNPITEVIRARKIEIINQNGKPVVVAMALKRGVGALGIYNKAGDERFSVTVGDNGGIVSVTKKNGDTSMIYSTDLEGDGKMTVFGKDGKKIGSVP